jgi:hypothetical protein
MSYLKINVAKAMPAATVVAVHDQTELDAELAGGKSDSVLLLVNRVLEPGFATESGLELLAELHRGFPGVRMVLVSNYADAQEKAVATGARAGFGKKDLGTPKMRSLLEAAAK